MVGFATAIARKCGEVGGGSERTLDPANHSELHEFVCFLSARGSPFLSFAPTQAGAV